MAPDESPEAWLEKVRQKVLAKYPALNRRVYEVRQIQQVSDNLVGEQIAGKVPLSSIGAEIPQEQRSCKRPFKPLPDPAQSAEKSWSNPRNTAKRSRLETEEMVQLPVTNAGLESYQQFDSSNGQLGPLVSITAGITEEQTWTFDQPAAGSSSKSSNGSKIGDHIPPDSTLGGPVDPFEKDMIHASKKAKGVLPIGEPDFTHDLTRVTHSHKPKDMLDPFEIERRHICEKMLGGLLVTKIDGLQEKLTSIVDKHKRCREERLPIHIKVACAFEDVKTACECCWWEVFGSDFPDDNRIMEMFQRPCTAVVNRHILDYTDENQERIRVVSFPDFVNKKCEDWFKKNTEDGSSRLKLRGKDRKKGLKDLAESVGLTFRQVTGKWEKSQRKNPLKEARPARKAKATRQVQKD